MIGADTCDAMPEITKVAVGSAWSLLASRRRRRRRYRCSRRRTAVKGLDNCSAMMRPRVRRCPAGAKGAMILTGRDGPLLGGRGAIATSGADDAREGC